MLDSESQLREAIQKMLRGEGNAPATDGHEDHGTMADTPATPATGHSGRPMNDSPGAAGASATEAPARACGTRLDAHADPAHAKPFSDQ
jgi:hypothetical protein